MKAPTIYHQFLISIFLLFVITIQWNLILAQKGKSGSPKVDIRNFQTRDLSSAELLVSVDYYYENFDTSDLAILATTEGNDVLDDEVPLRHGNNSVILRLQMSPSGNSYTSSSIRVCIANADTAILCKDFSFTKNWKQIDNGQANNGMESPTIRKDSTAAAPTVPISSSVITGEITGQITYEVVTEPGGTPQLMTLKYVIIEPVNQGGHAIPVKVIHRKYRFTTTAGITYKVYPANFPSDPRFKIVTTREHITDIVNFKIVGHPIID